MYQQSNSRTQPFRKGILYYYTGVIYKYIDMPLYDVAIYTLPSTQIPPPSTKYCQIYTTTILSEKQVKMRELTRYMRWKFNMYQVMVENNKPIQSGGLFTQIYHTFEWIKSIIDVEFDFHIGNKDCLKEENKYTLDIYHKNIYAGYGIEKINL